MSIFGKKIGVALSGGGYKGAAYHIGTLRALHRLGVLDKVDVISSASGGSITAAYYALNKDDYEEFERGFIKSLSKGVLWSSYLYLGIVLFLLLATSVAMGHLTASLTGYFFPYRPILSGVCAALGGVITLAPFLAAVLKPVIVPLYQAVGADPSMFATTLLACDMGGYPLAMQMAANPQIGRFAGIILGGMMGPTIVFSIPVALGIIEKKDHPALAKGILIGMVTIPRICSC